MNLYFLLMNVLFYIKESCQLFTFSKINIIYFYNLFFNFPFFYKKKKKSPLIQLPEAIRMNENET